MKTAETHEPIKIVPRLADIQAAGEVHRLKQQAEALMAGVGEWVNLIRQFISDAEGKGYFSNSEEGRIDDLESFKALKLSVCDDA